MKKQKTSILLSLLLCYAILYIFILSIKNDFMLGVLKPIATLLAYLSLRRFSKMQEKRKTPIEMVRTAYFLWMICDFMAFIGENVLSLSDEAWACFRNIEIFIYAVPRIIIVIAIYKLYYILTKKANKLQILGDQITVGICSLTSLWLLFINDNAYELSQFDSKAILSLIYVLICFSSWGGLLLSWLYLQEKSIPIGMRLLMLGIAIIPTLDFLQVIHSKLMVDNVVIEILYKTSILCVAIGGLLHPGYPFRERIQTKWNGDSYFGAWLNGSWFLVYPVFAALFKSVSSIFVAYVLAIMLYFIMRLYLKQINITKKLLDSEKKYAESLRMYMNVMNGIETAKIIKDGSVLSNIPATVLVTAFDKEELRKKAAEVKIDGFLAKPVSQSMLYDTVAKLFAPEKGMISEKQKIKENNYHLSGVKVLLVEDNEINQQIAEELLESQGLIVDIASNGIEAVRRIENMASENSYDIILMDLQMPLMDGFEASELIREKEKALPIIAMTARTMMEEREQCLASGMDDHIAKPIDPQMLFMTISKWITCLDNKAQINSNHETFEQGAGKSENKLKVFGVDTETGLKRVANNMELYSNLLMKYADNQTNTVVQLLNAFEQNDYFSVERLAHTLKGVSGNIGVLEVQGLAEKIEKQIKISSNSKEIEAALYNLEALVKKISESIKLQLYDSIEPKQDNLITDNQIIHDIEKLIEMLRDNDSEAVDYFDSVKGGLILMLKKDKFERIESAIKRFEYEDAVNILEAIIWKRKYQEESRKSP